MIASALPVPLIPAHPPTLRGPQTSRGVPVERAHSKVDHNEVDVLGL